MPRHPESMESKRVEQQEYLIFTLYGSLYGIAADAVREITWLPELTPAVEAPSYIAGLVNLRGRIAPVMDLRQRLGYPPMTYRATDSVIMLQWQGQLAGLVANEVRAVQNIDPDQIEDAPSYCLAEKKEAPFTAAVAKVGEEIITLLSLERLMSLPTVLPTAEEAETTPLPEAECYFCPTATPEERAVYHGRALRLMKPAETQSAEGLLTLAVVRLGDEYFGVETEHLREFAAVQEVTPIPCCPKHIVGHIKLRGEVMPLVDIRAALQMPLSSAGAIKQVMVVQLENSIGVLVDEVLDVVSIHPAAVTPIPAATPPAHGEYVKGAAPYSDKVLTIVNLSRVLNSPEMVVEDEI